MRSIRISALATAALLMSFSYQAVAHEPTTGMHISTKSPQAHAFFETGLQKMEMLHIQDALENFRNLPWDTSSSLSSHKIRPNRWPNAIKRWPRVNPPTRKKSRLLTGWPLPSSRA